MGKYVDQPSAAPDVVPTSGGAVEFAVVAVLIHAIENGYGAVAMTGTTR